MENRLRAILSLYIIFFIITCTPIAPRKNNARAEADTTNDNAGLIKPKTFAPNASNSNTEGADTNTNTNTNTDIDLKKQKQLEAVKAAFKHLEAKKVAYLNDIKLALKRPKVAQWKLDTQDFEFPSVVAGKRALLGHDIPILNFNVPTLADYTDIYRCECDATFNTFNLNEQNIPDNQQTSAVRDEITKSSKCTAFPMVNRNTVLDPGARSGCYVYILRACVHNSRIKDVVSSETCSRRFVISNKISHTNTKKEAQLEYEDKANQAMIDAMAEANILVNLSEEIVNINRACNDRKFKAQVTKKQRDAELLFVSIAVEVTMELATLQPDPHKGQKVSKLQHYKRGLNPKNGAAAMDVLQMLQALAGFSFHAPLMEVFTSSEDFPYFCAGSKAKKPLWSAQYKSLLNNVYIATYWRTMADIYEDAQDITKGKDVEIQTIDPNTKPEDDIEDFSVQPEQ
jgi:hypothetical protein